MHQFDVLNFARAALLCFVFAFTQVSGAQAHSLPGSTLTFYSSGGEVNLSITVPLHDLVIAAPQLRSLSKAALPTELKGDDLQELKIYLKDLFRLQKEGEDIALAIKNAVLQSDENQDVGEFTMLIINFSPFVKLKDGVFPMVLTYDAVMHEVRNHRATVFWFEPNKIPVKLAEFGFQRNEDGPIALSLKLQ